MTKRKYEPKERRKEFLRKTDTEKFANLIMKYQNDMYYLALSICKNEMDAQDIVGETIVKAFEARNQLRNDARFKYWIMKILTNTAYTYLKRKKRLVFEEPVEEIAAKNENPDHGLWAKVMEIGVFNKRNLQDFKYTRRNRKITVGKGKRKIKRYIRSRVKQQFLRAMADSAN